MCSRRYDLFHQIDVGRDAHARQLDHEYDVDAHGQQGWVGGYIHSYVAGDDDRDDAAVYYAHVASVSPRISISRRKPY